MANKKLNAVITIGGLVSNTLGTAIGGARSKMRQLGSTIKELERDQKGLNKRIHDGMRANLPVGAMVREYGALSGQIARARREQEKFNRARRAMEAGKARMGEAFASLTTLGAVAATAGLPVVQAASFETAMAGVAKQVAGARDAGGKLTPVYYEMAHAIQKLGREVPISTNELAGMVEAGARMGIQGKENLIEFTRTTAMMATALDLPREELSDNMGKIANLFHIPIPAVKNLGDAINYLDDNTVSKGGDIIDFLQRTGGVAGAVKVSAKEMAALGSTLLSMGERSETASTASNAFIQKLAAADKGSKKFRSAMDEIGMSTAEVQKGMQVDAQGTILKVLDAVNRMPKEQRMGVLVDLVGLEHSDTLAKLSGNVAEYRKQIEMAGSAKAQGSMSREFAAQLATTSAQWDILKNRVTEFSVNVGSVLLPTVNRAMAAIGRVGSVVADFARQHPVVVKSTLGVIGAVIGTVAAFKTAAFAWNAAGLAFNALKIVMATNPIGLVVAGLATAAVLVYQNWEPISGFFKGVWSDVVGAGKVAWDWIKSALSFTPLGMVVANWTPIGRFFGDVWGIVKDAAVITWSWLKNEFLSWKPIQLVTSNWGPISGFFGGLWANVKNGANVLWTWLRDGFLAFTPLGLIVKNWEPIKGFFAGLWAGLKSSAMGFLDWIVGKIAGIGDAVRSVREFMDGAADRATAPKKPGATGIASAKPQLASSIGRIRPSRAPVIGRAMTGTAARGSRTDSTVHGRRPPAIPPIVARRAGTVVNHNTKAEIHVHQQPGQDAKAVAKEVKRQLEKRGEKKSGAQLYDAPRGY